MTMERAQRVLMVPTLTDPRWRALVLGTERYGVRSLSVRLMLTRVRMLARADDEQSIASAIETAHGFFSSTVGWVRADLEVLFPAP